MAELSATYQRPVPAKLIVRLDNGEEWEAKSEDLRQFSLVLDYVAYQRFTHELDAILRNAKVLPSADLTDAYMNPIRELVETVLLYPEHLGDASNDTMRADVAAIERTLRAMARGDDITPGLLSNLWRTNPPLKVDILRELGGEHHRKLVEYLDRLAGLSNDA